MMPHDGTSSDESSVERAFEILSVWMVPGKPCIRNTPGSIIWGVASVMAGFG